jgi:hypothetical protein
VPAGWPKEEDQEQLADLAGAANQRFGFAVGCVWPAGTEHHVLEAVERTGCREDGEWQVSTVGRSRSGALLAVVARAQP